MNKILKIKNKINLLNPIQNYKISVMYHKTPVSKHNKK